MTIILWHLFGVVRSEVSLIWQQLILQVSYRH